MYFLITGLPLAQMADNPMIEAQGPTVRFLFRAGVWKKDAIGVLGKWFLQIQERMLQFREAELVITSFLSISRHR